MTPDRPSIEELLDGFEESIRMGFRFRPDIEDRIAAARESLLSRFLEQHKDAARWRAMVSCPRINILGGARFDKPGWLLGVEFHDDYPSGFTNAEEVETLTRFADFRAAIQPEGTPQK